MADRPKRLELPYKPNGPGQQAFADAVASGARTVLALGGVRSGKTFWACVEALKQIYIYQRLPTLGWLVARTYPMSLILERMWKQLCLLPDGTNLIAHERRAERAFLMRPTKKHPNNFFRVEIKSADDPKHLRGTSIAFAVADEVALMDRMVHTTLQARVMDNGGTLLYATTPIGTSWLASDIVQKSTHDPKTVVVRMATEQNSYLKSEEIEYLKEQYGGANSSMARQELYGEMVDFEGKVFNHFQPGTHIVKTPVLPDTTPIYCGIDWGYNDPFVCVFCAQVDGVWYVVDEYYKTRGLLSDHVSYIKNHPLWPQVKRVWCDPSGAQQRKEFLQLGIQCIPARRPKDAKRLGWPEMRARLLNKLFASRLKDPYGKETIPGLVYSDSIKFGLKETLGLCFEKFTSVVEDPKSGDVHISVVDRDGASYDRNAKEKIMDKDNHFVDALGYCLFSEVRTFGGLNAHYEGVDGSVVKQTNPTDERSGLEKLEDEIEARFEQEKRRMKAEKEEKKDSYKEFELNSDY